MKPRTKVYQWLLLAALLLTVVQVSEAGKLRRVFYEQITGAWVTNLFGTNIFGVVVFPDQPGLIPDYMPPQQGIGSVSAPFVAVTVTNSGFPNDYGSYVQGYFTAPETGTYTFYLTSDDEAQWWMNTDSTDPLNRTKTNLLAWVPGWAGAGVWDKFPEQTSAPVSLEAGKTYYMEIYHKEGSGGDHIQLGWTRPNGITERPMPSFHFQPARDTRWGEPDVEVVAGAVNPIPGDYAIYDGMEVVVYANVNLDPPLTYTWFKNNAPYPAAQGSYHKFRATTADNNSQWRVQVNSGGQNYNSVDAYLLVLPDQIKPTVLSAGTMPYNPTMIRIVFSEGVKEANALQLSNYNLPGATIYGATLAPDGQTVYLQTDLLSLDQAWVLSVSGMQDYATPANTMDPVQVTLLPGDGALSYRIWYTTQATDLASLRTWSGVNSTSPTYTGNQFNEERTVTSSSYQWNLAPARDNFTAQLIGYFTAPETGNYRFGITSDDSSVLYLGTNHLREGKREVAYMSSYSGRWEWSKEANQLSTSDVYLEAGKRYYIEAVHRDGTGGDGVTIIHKKPSDATWPPPGTAQADVEPYLLPASQMSPYVTYSPLVLKTDLAANLSAAASTRPTLSVAVDGYLPWNFQWYSNGVAIAGATSASYQLPFLALEDTGAKFQVIITNNFSSVTSTLLTLNVFEDTTKPTVVAAGSVLKQQVELTFSEPLDTASASSSANYKLYTSANVAVPVTSVTFDEAAPTRVTLQTGAMPEADLMRLEITGVKDLASLTIDAATNIFRALNFDMLERINNSQAYSAVANGDQLTMVAGGGDIWGNADQMAFLYKSVTGNFDYKFRADSLERADNWTKFGIMARHSTQAGSPNWFMSVTPNPGQATYTAQTRETQDAASTSSNDANSPLNLGLRPGVAARPGVSYPTWIRLQRVGNVINYHFSSNGTDWTWYTSYDSTFAPAGPFPNTLLVGVALTSHNTGMIAAGQLTSFMPVDDGPLTFTVQPTNNIVMEGGNVTFYSGVTGNSPFFYQWFKRGSAIEGATNATLNLNRVPFSDDQATISVQVTNPYTTTGITSTNAILTVIKDTVAPTVAYYGSPKINLRGTEVELIYSEPVNKAEAETVSNYSIVPEAGGTPLVISTAMLAADERVVTLTTSPQVAGTLYKVVVNNVHDLACCPPNAIPANSTDYYFFSGAPVGDNRFRQRADGFVVIEAENYSRKTASSAGLEWQLQSIAQGYSGIGYMVVTNVGASGGSITIAGGVGTGTGAAMEFDIVFERPATNYTLWVRGWNQNTATSGNDDSTFIGFDGQAVWLGPSNNSGDYSILAGWGAAGWDWRSDRGGGTGSTDPLVISNVVAGTHTLIIWHREDGTLIDKIVIEPGVRSNAGNSTEPTVASTNGGRGENETWDWQVPPPGAPSISIINPTNNQVFAGNANITLEANVTLPSPVKTVEFLTGTNVIGTVTAAPFSVVWANVPEGIYTVNARVTDVLGYTTTSAGVRLVVDSSKPVPFAVGSSGADIGVYFADVSGLNAETATNIANYVVNNGAVAVTNAWLETDGLAVILQIDQPISGAFNVKVQNVQDQGFGPNVVETVTLQSEVLTLFENQDVGTTNTLGEFTNPVLAGFAEPIGTEGYYLRAGGSDIWGNADGMHFAYTEITGDFDLVTMVGKITRPDNWTKAGLMVREDLEGTSRNYIIAATPTNGQNQVTVQWRTTKGATSASIADNLRPRPSGLPSSWLRITRTNQTFSFYFATNGVDWAELYTTESSSPYPETVYVGLALTSHNNGTNVANLASAYFYNLSGFQSGAVAPAPAISASVSGNNLVLTWTSATAGFKVQSTDSLAGGTWTDEAVTPVAEGNNYTVTLPIGTGSKFYRLMLP